MGLLMKLKGRHIFNLLTLLFFHSLTAQHQVPINGEETIFLGDHVQILPDYSGNLTPDILDLYADDYDFQPYQDLHTNKEDKSIPYWLKVEFSNNTSKPQAYILECFDPKIDQITIFRRYNGGWKEFVFGATKDFEQKIIKHKNFHLPLVFEPESAETFYIKMYAERKVSFKWVLRSNEIFINYALQEYTFQGFLSGFIFMLIIFNLFMFIASRQRVYFSFIFFILSNLLYILSINGIGFQYLWPSFPGFNSYASGIFSLAMCAGLYVYLKEFLNINSKHEHLFNILKWFIFARAGLFFVGLVYHDFLNDARIDFITFLAALVIGIKLHDKKKPSDRYFIGGLYVITIALFVHALWIQDYVDFLFPFIEKHVYYVYALAVGILIELCCFTAAIAFQVKALTVSKITLQEKLVKELKEKDKVAQKVNKELEGLVDERTYELDKKNKELEELISLTNSFNIQLDQQNRSLTKTIEEQNRRRILLNDELVTMEEFKKIFPTKITCLQLLEELKWKESFQCVKCGNEEYKAVGKEYSRKCTRCYHIESVTVNTLFHRLRFPIQTAFYLVYLISVKPKTTIDELQEITGLRRATVWSFKKKVEMAIEFWKGKKKDKPFSWEELILTPVNKIKKKQA